VFCTVTKRAPAALREKWDKVCADVAADANVNMKAKTLKEIEAQGLAMHKQSGGDKTQNKLGQISTSNTGKVLFQHRRRDVQSMELGSLAEIGQLDARLGKMSDSAEDANMNMKAKTLKEIGAQGLAMRKQSMKTRTETEAAHKESMQAEMLLKLALANPGITGMPLVFLGVCLSLVFCNKSAQ
jgi:hypothetical protein